MQNVSPAQSLQDDELAPVDPRTGKRDEHLVSRLSYRLAHSEIGVGVLSVGESTVVPIPLEAVIMPLMIAWPRRAWFIATAALVGALVGASAFYFLGHLLFDPVVLPLLQQFGLEQDYRAALDNLSEESLFWSVFLISVGPAPLQLATLGAGASSMSYLTFIAAIATSRAIRYLGLALLCNLLGERIKRYRVPKWVTVSASVAFLLAFWVIFSFMI